LSCLNSVLHARLGPGELIEVTICREDDRLEIVVADSGGFSGRTRHKPGLGFRVLDAVCDQWHAEGGCVRASISIGRPKQVGGGAARRGGVNRIRMR